MRQTAGKTLQASDTRLEDSEGSASLLKHLCPTTMAPNHGTSHSSSSEHPHIAL